MKELSESYELILVTDALSFPKKSATTHTKNRLDINLYLGIFRLIVRGALTYDPRPNGGK
jgi:hypothetical protein